MTGDYPSLSATDIKVPALTYQLETENVGTEHLKKEPEEKAPSMQHTETPDGIAGFHFPSKAADAITDTDQLESVDLSADGQLAASEDRDGSNEDQHEEEEESSDDGGGWITPSNIKQVQMDAGNWGPTADNVLIQIGLHVLSVNGMLIKYSRSYILRCHACFKTTTNMNKSFCPHCGNNTLKKIAVSINEDGTMQMHFSGNPKVLNPKGKRQVRQLTAAGRPDRRRKTANKS
ncbi:hypothetical protein cypCar_00020779 [Cyprinus carpio]|nr:hypothetical protein cypCar_00020779 [Cyprinus carpio]